MAERGLTPAPLGDHGDKTEEFERFMATSIRAFDAMMDAVQSTGSSPPRHLPPAPTPPPFTTPDGHHLPPNLSGLADSNSVAIVGNEYMVSQVARAYASQQQETSPATQQQHHAIDDGGALEWHKARIAYLEGVRADLARQLEHERHDRRSECEEVEEACSSRVREVQAQLANEREHRVEAEARVGEAFSEEATRLAVQLREANERGGEGQTRCRALEVKVEFLNSERTELLADRDAARALLAAHEGDMDRLEAQLVRLQVQERVGNGLRHAGMVVKASARRALSASFMGWKTAVQTDHLCHTFLVAGGCRQSASTLSRLRNKSMRSAWGKWRRGAVLQSSSEALHVSQAAWEQERRGIVAERVAAAAALDNLSKAHAFASTSKVISKIQRGVLAKGWRSWVAHVQKARAAVKRRGEQGSMLLASTSKLRLKCLGRTFRKLTSQTARCAASLAASAMEATLGAERKSFLFSSALQLFGTALLTSVTDRKRFALNRLKRAVALNAHAKQKLRSFVKALVSAADASVRRGFSAWVHFSRAAAASAEAKGRSVRLLLRMAVAGAEAYKARALRKWVKAVASVREEEKVVATAQRNCLQSMSSTIKRLQHSSLHAATSRWRRHALALAAAKNRSAELMKATMLKMLRQQLSRGWGAWARHVRVVSEQGLKSERTQHASHAALRLMRRCLTRFSKHQTRKAFNALEGHCFATAAATAAAEAKSRDTAAFLTKFVRRMLNVCVVGAWQRWHSAVTQEKNKARYLKSVLRVCFTRDEKDSAAAFARWVMRARAAKAHGDASAVVAAMEKRLREQGLVRLSAVSRGCEARKLRASWLTWKKAALLAFAVVSAQRRFLGIVASKSSEGERALKAVAFHRILHSTARREEQNRVIKRVLARLLKASTKRAFGVWMAQVRASKREEREEHAETQATAKARQWGGVSSLSALLKRWQVKGLSQAWRKWHTQSFHDHAMTKLVREKAVRRCAEVVASKERRLVVKGWRAWAAWLKAASDLAELQARKEAKAALSLKRMAYAKVGGAWRAWRWVVQRSHELESGVSMLTNLLTRRALRHWSHGIARQRLGERLGRRVCVALSKSIKNALLKAWRQWAHTYTAMARLSEKHAGEVQAMLSMASNAKMKKVVSRVLKAQLWGGFHKWVGGLRAHQKVAAHRTHLKVVVVRRMRAMLRGGLARGWTKWKEALTAMELTASRATLTRHLSQHEFTQGLESVSSGADKTWGLLSRKDFLRLTRSFGVWHSCLRDAHLMLRAFTRVVFSTTSRAFEQWLVGVERKRKFLGRASKALGNVRRALTQFSKRSRLRALHKWRVASWALAQRAQHEHARRLQVGEKAFKKMLHAHLTKGWRQWAAVAASVKASEALAMHRLSVIQRVLSTLGGRKLQAAMRSWGLFVEAAQEANEKAKRVVGRLLQGADRALQRGGFAHWRRQVGLCAQADEHRSRTLCLLTGRSTRKVAAAMRQWKALAECAGQLHKVLPRLLARLKVSNTRSSLRKWQGAVKAAEASDLRAKDVGSGVALMRRTMLGMQRAQLSNGWRAWRLCYSARVLVERKERHLKRVGAAMFRRQALAAVATWRAQSRDWRRKNKALERYARKMQRRKLSQAVVGWRFHLAAKASHGKEVLSRKAVFRRTLHTLAGKKTAQAWRRWLACVAEQKRVEAQAQEAAGAVASKLESLGVSLTQTMVGRAFRSWLTFTTETRERERECSDVAQRRRRSLAVVAQAKAAFSKKEVTKAFRTWHLEVNVRHAKAKAACATLLNSYAKAGNARVLLAWRKWGDVSSHAHAQRKVLVRMVRKKKGCRLRCVLSHWRRATVESRESARRWEANGKAILGVYRCMCSSAKVGAWVRWKECHVRGKERERVLKRASRIVHECHLKMKHRDLAKGWRSLVDQVKLQAAKEAEVKRRMGTLVKVMQGKADLKLSRSFRALRVFAEQSASCEAAHAHLRSTRHRVLRKVHTTVTKRGLAAAWKQWKASHATELLVGKALRSMRSLLAAVAQRALTKGWRSWLAYSTAAELESLRTKHALTLSSSQAAAAGFYDSSKLLAKCFACWARVAVDPRYEDPSLRCARLLHSCTEPRIAKAKVKALSTWRRFVRSHDAAAAQRVKKEALLRRVVVVRVGNRAAALSFGHWKLRTTQASELRRRTSRALASTRSLLSGRTTRNTFRAWGTWVRFAMSAARVGETRRHRLRLSLELMASKGAQIQRAALRRWGEFAIQCVKEKEAQRATEQKLRRTLNRFTELAPLEDAFACWRRKAVQAGEELRYSQGLGSALEEQKKRLEGGRDQQRGLLSLRTMMDSKTSALTRKGFATLRSHAATAKQGEWVSGQRASCVGHIVRGWMKKKLIGAYNKWRGNSDSLAVHWRRYEDKLSVCSKYVANWTAKSCRRALFHWRLEAGIASLSLSSEASNRRGLAGLGAGAGASVVEKLVRRRSSSSLRRAVDQWFLFAHSNELEVVSASRAAQMLFAVDMRLMQRSLLRWRSLAGAATGGDSSSFSSSSSSGRHKKRAAANGGTPVKLNGALLLSSPSAAREDGTQGSNNGKDSATPVKKLGDGDDVYGIHGHVSPSSPLTPYSPPSPSNSSHSSSSSAPPSTPGSSNSVSFSPSHHFPASSSSPAHAPSTSSSIVKSSVPLQASRQTRKLVWEESGHFRRLLWAHMKSKQESGGSWFQGRQSVLGASQRTVTALLCRRLTARHLWSAFNRWRQAHTASAKLELKCAVQAAGLAASTHVLQKWSLRSSRQAFGKWSKQTASSRRTLERQSVALNFTHRWLSRVRLKTVGAAFEKWCGRCDSMERLFQAKKSYLGALGRLVGRADAEKVRRKLVVWRSAAAACGVAAARRRAVLKRASAALLHSGLKQALQTWRCQVRRWVEERRVLKKALARVAEQLLSCAWQSWGKFVHLKGEAQDLASKRHSAALRLSQRLLRGLEARALRQWRSSARAVAEEKLTRDKNDASLQRALKMVESGILRKGWNTWRNRVESFFALRDLMRKLVGGHRAATLKSAFQTWHRTATFVGRQGREFSVGLRAVSRVIASATSQSTSRAFRSWQHFSLKASAARALGVEKGLREREERSANLSKAHKALTRMLLVAVASAWRTWLNKVAQRCATETRKRSSARHFGNLLGGGWRRMASRALHTWKLGCFRAQAGTTHARSLQLLTEEHALKLQALETDLQRRVDADRAKVLKTLCLVGSSAALRQASLAFNSWRAVLKAQDLKRSEAELVIEVQCKALQTLCVAAGMRGSRMMGVAWLQWKRSVEGRRRHLQRVRVHLKECGTLWVKVRLLAQRRLLQRWRDTVHAIKASGLQRSHALQRGLNMLVVSARRWLAKAWAQWRSQCLASSVGAALTLQLTRMRLSKLRADQRVMDVLSVGRAWRVWNSAVRQAQAYAEKRFANVSSVCALLSRVLTHSSGGAALRALNSWKAFVSVSVCAEQAKLANHATSSHLMQRCVRRMQKGLVEKAWKVWVRLATLSKSALDTFAALEVSRRDAAAVTAEAEADRLKASQQRTVRRVVARLVGKAQGLAFAHWHRAGVAAAREEAAATAKQIKLRSTLEKMVGAAERRKAAGVSSCLGAAVRKWALWAKLSSALTVSGQAEKVLLEARRVAALEAKEAKQHLGLSRLEWAVAAATHKRLRCAWRKWGVDSKATDHRLRRFFARLAGGAVRKSQGAALRTWKQHRFEAAEAERKRAQETSSLFAAAARGGKDVSAVLKNWSHRQTAKMFRTWQLEVAARKSRELYISSGVRDVSFVLKSWSHRQCSKGFRRWQSEAALGKQREQHVASTLSLIRDKALQHALATQSTVELRAKTRAMSKWLAATNVDRQMSLSFSLLRLNLRNQSATVRRFMRRRQEVALTKWRRNASALERAVALAKAVKTSNGVGKAVGKAFRTWLAQVWTHRFLVLKEGMALKALEQVSRLRVMAEEEIAKLQRVTAPYALDAGDNSNASLQVGGD